MLPGDPRAGTAGTGTAGTGTRPSDPTAIVSAYATTAQWRRIILERQLPRVRRAGGVALPLLAGTAALLAVAALCALYLQWPAAQRVPDAVVDSRRDATAAMAYSLAATCRREVAAAASVVRGLAGGPNPDYRSVLARASTALSGRGGAVVDLSTRAVLATAGEPVDAGGFAPDRAEAGARVEVGPDGTGRLVLAAPLSGAVFVLVATDVEAPTLQADPPERPTLVLALRNGGITDFSTGAHQPLDPATGVLPLIQRAVRDGDRRPAAVVGRPPGDGSGALLVAAAPVPGLEVQVVSVSRAQTGGGHRTWPGLPAALALAVLALGGGALLWAALVRPLRRLLRHAQAVACGQRDAGARRSRISEIGRIGAALHRARISAPGEPPWGPAVRVPVPAVTALVLVTAALLGWCGYTGLAVTGGDRSLPATMGVDAASQAGAAAARLREALEQGVVRLRDAAETIAAPGGALTPVLTQLAVRGSGYRSVYLLGLDGQPAATAGRAPRRTAAPPQPQSGLWLDEGEHTVPVIYAQVRLGDGRALVGEFDLAWLMARLRRAQVRVHVVDGRLRQLLDTHGYRAFEALTGDALRRAAGQAQAAGTPAPVPATGTVAGTGRPVAGVVAVHGVPTQVSAAALGWDDRLGTAPWTGGPPWALVAEHPVSDYLTPGNALRRQAWLVATLALTVTVVLAGWLFLVVILPLRALAGQAARFAGGDTRTVIAPVRQDEVGAVAMCLEVSRQAEVYGEDRLAGAARVRGSGGTHTMVIPAQRVERPPARHRAGTGPAAGQSDGRD